MERFVLHWGDMGGRWGVNRSVAQIHALLLASSRPLNAEEIAASLSIARSNVSNSLKELQNWGLIVRAPVKGDRRDHFEALDDIWASAARIVERRKALEIDPARDVLSSCLAEMGDDPAASGPATQRLEELKTLIDLVDDWYDQMKDVPPDTLIALLRMGSKVIEFLKPFLKRPSASGGDRSR